MSKITSCVGCKFLFGDGSGYSDWTWEETNIRCAKDLNANLPVAGPYDWNQNEEKDNLPATRNGRCSAFSPGPYIVISPDRYWDEAPIDDDQKAAIEAVCGEFRQDK